MQKKVIVLIITLLGIFLVLMGGYHKQYNSKTKQDKIEVQNDSKKSKKEKSKTKKMGDVNKKTNLNNDKIESKDESNEGEKLNSPNAEAVNEEEAETDQDGNVIFKYSNKNENNVSENYQKNKKDNSKKNNRVNNDKTEIKGDASQKDNTEADDAKDGNIEMEDGGIELPVVPAE